MTIPTSGSISTRWPKTNASGHFAECILLLLLLLFTLSLVGP